jgi:hypothetical protein
MRRGLRFTKLSDPPLLSSFACLLFWNDAAGDAALAPAILWLVSVVVAAFMDHQGAASDVRHFQILYSHALFNLSAFGDKLWKVAIMTATVRAFVGSGRFRVVMRTRCVGSCHLSIFLTRRAVALFVDVEAVLAITHPGHTDFNGQAVRSVRQCCGTNRLANALGGDSVDLN